MTNSIYIHIPFCKSICSYCDFCKFYYNSDLVDKYLDCLKREITQKYKNEIIETLYIGGGSPSSLSINQLNKLFSITDDIQKHDNIEFTIECNVTDITLEKLELFKKHKVNRISIGVQSFDTDVLTFLERNYTKTDIIKCINLVKKYFDNINIDLIYAVCNEDLNILKRDIELFLDLGVPHISTYSLMIEDNTILGIKKVLPISEDVDRDMYETIENILTHHGYIHYEISNYAYPGYESKHNMTYWKNQQYYGFGINASGYVDGYRYTNTKNVNKYLLGNYVQEKELITPEIDASNYAILGLRTLNGVNKELFIKKFDIDFIKYFNIEKLLEENIILETEKSYYLNPKYWYISNEILIKFV